MRVRFQDHRQRGPKVYALHAPEVECIGKGNARASYELGCKVSIATPATKPRGSHFVLQRHGAARQLVRRPQPGAGGRRAGAPDRGRDPPHPRIHVDAGYRGHNHRHKFRVWITGQMRRVTGSIRREMKRRARPSPVAPDFRAS